MTVSSAIAFFGSYSEPPMPRIILYY